MLKHVDANLGQQHVRAMRCISGPTGNETYRVEVEVQASLKEAEWFRVSVEPEDLDALITDLQDAREWLKNPTVEALYG